MTRRKAREYVLQVLFQRDFTGREQPPETFTDLLADTVRENSQRTFAEELIRGTIEHLDELDEVIQKAAEHWDVKRMAAVDRNILRSAAYELLFRTDMPAAVTINEALEIAKKYSSAESAPFINGLLDKIARDRAREKA